MDLGASSEAEGLKDVLQGAPKVEGVQSEISTA